MTVDGVGGTAQAVTGGPRDLEEGWDVATVVAEFDVAHPRQAIEVADLLFSAADVLTVRVGGVGERSVYRVDVPRGAPRARELGAVPALRAAEELGVELTLVRIGITPDGLGDPEGDPPDPTAVPWARRAHRAQGAPR